MTGRRTSSVSSPAPGPPMVPAPHALAARWPWTMPGASAVPAGTSMPKPWQRGCTWWGRPRRVRSPTEPGRRLSGRAAGTALRPISTSAHRKSSAWAVAHRWNVRGGLPVVSW